MSHDHTVPTTDTQPTGSPSDAGYQAALHNPFNPSEVIPEPAPLAPTGPHVPSLVLGLLGLVFAALVFVDQTTGINVDVARTAPWVIIGLGGVLLIVGALGIGRRRG